MQRSEESGSKHKFEGCGVIKTADYCDGREHKVIFGTQLHRLGEKCQEDAFATLQFILSSDL